MELSVEELAEAAGVPVRTVRYYVTEGLIPGPGGRGRAAAYGDEHLLRLRLVRRLAEQRVPLAEIRARVGALPLRDVADLLADEERRAARAEAERASPKAYVSALLDRARSLNARAPRPSAAPSPTTSLPPPWPAPPAAPPGAPPPIAASGPLLSATRAPAHLPPPATPPLPPERWTRWELAPGVELHVRADAADAQRRLVRRLIDAANDQLPNQEEQ